MLDCIGDEEIVIINGDTFNLAVDFNNLSGQLIDKIIFSSKGINFTKAFDKLDDKINSFLLIINSIETEDFSVGVFDYDLTVIFQNGDIETISYKSKLKILKKTNPIDIVNKGNIDIGAVNWDKFTFTENYHDKDIEVKGKNNKLIISIIDNGNIDIEYKNGIVKAENLEPNNIKKGVEIFGITGTYDNATEGDTPGVYVEGEDLIFFDTTHYKNYIIRDEDNITKLVIDSPTQINVDENGIVTANNLTTGNIKNGVTILGIEGDYETPTEGALVTPTKEEQEIVATTEGYHLDKVIVEPIPDEYIIPSGKKTIINTDEVNVREFETAQVVDSNLIASNIKKNVNILGVEGSYDNSIPGIYFGNQSISFNGNTFLARGLVINDELTIPKSYYDNNGRSYITINTTNVNIEESSDKAALNICFNSDNLKALLFKDTSIYNYNGNHQVIDWLTGKNVLLSENIKKGINILGIDGSYEGADTSDSTATSDDILLGKTAYIKSGKTTGTIQTYANEIENGEIVERSLKKLLDSTKSAYYLFNNYTGTNVNDLIQYSDTENVTNMSRMFSYCTNLTTIPLLDTANVTNMYSIFEGCKKITTIPLLNTTNVTSMDNMFYGCTSLTSIPLLNTNNVTDTSGMFINCSKLVNIPQLDVSNVINTNGMFRYCTNLKSILMYGMKVSFDIHYSTQFEESDLVTILNNLATVTGTTILTMGEINLAKLTDEDKAIATSKGWTLA